MTGLVRKATILAMCGSLASAAAALAGPPEPSTSDCPDFIFVSVFTETPSQAPDTLGQNSKAPNGALRGRVVIRTSSGIPISNASVAIQIPCCDICLCDATIAGQTVACGSPATVSGTTDLNGAWVFHLIGAARNPDTQPVEAGTLYGGCGLNGAKVFAETGTGPVLMCQPTVVVLDQDGAMGAANEPVTVTDVVKVNHDMGRIALGAPYVGRDDLNANGAITVADVSE